MTVSAEEYAMAVGCVWFDNAFQRGLIDGESPVDRQKCLDVIAVAREHESVEIRSPDDERPDHEIAAEMLLSLLMECLELDREEARRAADAILALEIEGDDS